MGAQQIEYARDAGDYGNLFAADGLDEALRLEARFEMNFCAEDRRDPQTHELAEDMAEGQRVQKVQRVEDALVLEVLLHLGLDGVETRKHIAMGMDDSLGLGGGAGGKENLKGRVEGECGIAEIGLLRLRQGGGKVFKAEFRQGWKEVWGEFTKQRRIADDEPGLCVVDDAIREVQGSGGIERDHDDATLDAAEECAHPLKAVLSPDDDALAEGDFAANQLRGEAIGEVGDLIPRGDQAAIAAMDNDGGRVTVAAVVVEECR
jgi:hypothetical protein